MDESWQNIAKGGDDVFQLPQGIYHTNSIHSNDAVYQKVCAFRDCPPVTTTELLRSSPPSQAGKAAKNGSCSNFTKSKLSNTHSVGSIARGLAVVCSLGNGCSPGGGSTSPGGG